MAWVRKHLAVNTAGRFMVMHGQKERIDKISEK